MNSRPAKIFLALVFPPLAVIDKGCGTVLVVSLLTFPLWFPGFIAALLIVLADKSPREPQLVEIGSDLPEKEKNKGAYIRLADGEVARVVEDDHAPLDGFRGANTIEPPSHNENHLS